jgi:hypothetical protein
MRGLFEKARKYDLAFFPGDHNEFELVADALEQLRKAGSPHKTVVVPRWGYKLSEDCHIRAASLQMDIRTEMLDASAYATLYLDSKVAVFPYVGEYYRYTSSGRLLDAASAGCYSLAPQGSLTGSQAEREGWGESFEVQSLSSSILKALSVWDSYKILSAPAPEATIQELLQSGVREDGLVVPTHGTRFGKYLMFYMIFLGTGFRSWAPRVFQALQQLKPGGGIKWRQN